MQALVIANLIQHFKAGHIRQHQIEHHAVVMLVSQFRKRFSARRDGRNRHIIMTDQFDDGFLLNFIIFYDEQVLQTFFRI
ncbi:hypothetical protein D3C77_516630 [compost metagenome]